MASGPLTKIAFAAVTLTHAGFLLQNTRLHHRFDKLMGYVFISAIVAELAFFTALVLKL
jgi:ABC-type iron transport system FetAB permease component